MKLTKERKPPKYFSELQQEHWGELQKSLIKDGRIEDIDLGLLEMACVCYSDFRTAESIAERKRAIDSYSKIMQSFEATPKARRNSTTNKEQDDEDILG